MASSARIEELRKKFEENPRRYFAPLANEYRKAGDVEQAIAICRDYLPQQPGHMSGHIVYGQALYEARQFEEAKSVFETALALDPENLIALRHLGDISLILGDTEGARTWYGRVLEADPRNEEIQAQLQGLEASGGAPAPSAPTPVSTAAVPPVSADPSPAPTPADPSTAPTVIESLSTAPTVVVSPMTLEIEKTPDEPMVSSHDEPPPMLDLGSAPTAEIVLDQVSSPKVPQLDGMEDLPGAPAIDSFQLDGLETTSMASGAPAPAEPEASQVPLMELDLAAPEPPAGGGPTAGETQESPPPGASADLPLIDLGESVVTPAEPARSEAPPPALPDFVAPAQTDAAPVHAVARSTPPPMDIVPRVPTPAPVAAVSEFTMIEPEPEAAPPAPVAAAESRPFVTETMAELYEQQGHRDEALAVYRALAGQRPDDASLRQKIAALESTQGPTIRELIRLVAGRRPRVAAATQAPAETMDEFSAAAPASTSPASGAGAETAAEFSTEATASVHHASGAGATAARPDALGALFGAAAVPDRDETSARTLATAFSRNGGGDGGAQAAPLAGAPAHPAARDLSLDAVFGRGAGAGGQTGGFSFDRFFSERAATDNAPAASGGEAKESEDDVARFTQWLEGLKQR